MKHFTIEIHVAYDDVEEVPSEEELESAVNYAVSNGMLTPSYEEVVEEYSVSVYKNGN